MDFTITTQDYIAYLHAVRELLRQNKEYISALDATTGDGDHWANLHAGFEKLTAESPLWQNDSLSELFQKCAKTLMSGVGGSSGVLYGSAYLEASNAAKDMDALHLRELFCILDSMCRAIMKRGQAEPGFKTMVDAIYPAVESYRQGLASHTPAAQLLPSVRQAALDGAAATKAMPAVKGRARYQAGKGIGHLDPGAVTMSYQICALMDCALSRLS